MSRSLYPSPKSVAVQQPVTGEVEEELCDTVPHLSLSDPFHTYTCKKLLGGDSDVSGELRAHVTLGEFINELPQTIKKSRSVLNRGAIDDDVSALFRRLDLREEDWKPYAFFEPSKLYTRNLVATDDETFTLILMCWNAGKESPIHDHPCDGCWMHVCEGSVRETRYVKHDGSDALRCVSDDLFTENQLAYITDSMGLHKVANPSYRERAVTLHLYSPPFESCQIWLDPNNASKPSNSRMCFHSINGCVVSKNK